PDACGGESRGAACAIAHGPSAHRSRPSVFEIGRRLDAGHPADVASPYDCPGVLPRVDGCPVVALGEIHRMSLHRMAPVDAAWFHMDGRANLAMVTSVALTRKPLDFGKVKALYSARLSAFPRFRQRVVERGLPLPVPHWEDVPDFDISQHLHHVALPQPGDRHALAQLLGDIVSTPLDRLQPLWQVHVIDGVDGGSALVTRFHHCIGDGTAMTALSMVLYDETPDAPPGGHEAAAPNAGRDTSGGWFDSAFDALGASAKAVVSAANAALDVVGHPQALIEKAGLVAAGAGMLL